MDGSTRKQAITALVKLQTNPELHGQPLGSRATGNLTNFRKLVVGDRDYRIVYQVLESGDVVVVWVIAKRADAEVYERAIARLRTHNDSDVRDLGEAIGTLIRRTGPEPG